MKYTTNIPSKRTIVNAYNFNKGSLEEAYWFSMRINFDSRKGDVERITLRIDSVILIESKTMLLQAMKVQCTQFQTCLSNWIQWSIYMYEYDHGKHTCHSAMACNVNILCLQQHQDVVLVI